MSIVSIKIERKWRVDKKLGSYQKRINVIKDVVELFKELPRTPCVLDAGLNWHGAKRQGFV